MRGILSEHTAWKVQWIRLDYSLCDFSYTMPASVRGEVDMRFCPLLAHSLVDGHKRINCKGQNAVEVDKRVFSFSWVHRGTMEVLFKWGLENRVR